MRKAQKMLAVILAVLLLVSSGVSGITTAFAVEGKSTEAATEQTTEGHKVAQKVEPETALQTRSGSGPETESETKQTETETQTQKETEPETKKPAETESEEPETKKPANEKPSKPAANEPVSDVKAPKESGVSISSPKDLEAFFKDPNFGQAVYDALASYDNDLYGWHGWLSGDPENPPQSIQEILETYRGSIDARYKDIDSIEGIHYLKLAATDSDDSIIDLRNNNITSLMPLTVGCDSEMHYGGYLEVKSIDPRTKEVTTRTGWMSVRLNVLNNPIKCFPDPTNSRKLGLLDVQSISRNDVSLVEGNEQRFCFLRTEANQKFDGKTKVGYCKYENLEEGNNVPLSSFTVDEDKSGAEWKLEDNVYASFKGLTKSSLPILSVTSKEIVTFYTKRFSSSINGDPIVDIWSYSYDLFPTFNIYDGIKVKGESTGKARVYKTDEATGKALKGAKFSLYKVGNSEPIRTDLLTDDDGYTETVENLPKGDYYFVETEAPDGYKADTTKRFQFSVGYSPAIKGGVKELNCSGELAKAGEDETFITWQMKNPVDFYLRDGSGKDVGNGDNIVKNVTISYSSLNGETTETIEYAKSLAEAEDNVKAHVSNNDITGPVTATVEYDEAALATVTVEATNEPVVNVQIDKTWKGIGADDTDLPEVNYTLYRTKKNGEKETVGECKVLVAGKEETVTVTDGKVTIPADSPKENYKCTYIDLPKYEKSSDGTYVTNDDGKLYAYKYFAKEEITQEEDGKYEKEGDVGEASDPVKQDDGTELITIPVTNYRKGKVKIQKSDSSQQREDLSGVRFKLEQEVTKDGVTSWDEVETGTTDAKGALEFKWLSWGKYRLTETQTWDGYILLQDPIVFEVKKEEIQDPNDFVYMIPNDYKFSVPRSGGIGSFWFLVSGSLLILIGGLWAYKRRFCIK